MPESYWQAWMAEYLHLRPSDIGEMTYYQLDACRSHVESKGVTFPTVA